jgi:hypothetical protein
MEGKAAEWRMNDSQINRFLSRFVVLSKDSKSGIGFRG